MYGTSIIFSLSPFNVHRLGEGVGPAALTLGGSDSGMHTSGQESERVEDIIRLCLHRSLFPDWVGGWKGMLMSLLHQGRLVWYACQRIGKTGAWDNYSFYVFAVQLKRSWTG